MNKENAKGSLRVLLGELIGDSTVHGILHLNY